MYANNVNTNFGIELFYAMFYQHISAEFKTKRANHD